MNPCYESLHNEMREEIKESQDTDLPETERAAVGFWIANTYWGKLKQTISSLAFKDDLDEIEFFKTVKPRFTCYMEYFVLLSGAFQFVPNDKNESKKYWEEEAKRLDLYRNKHNATTLYYESGATHRDKEYYTRVCEEQAGQLRFASYDSDADWCSLMDHYLRGLMARKMYVGYVKRKLEEFKVEP